MTHFIEKLWKLPPPEKRQLLAPFFSKSIRKNIRLERDGDYLCYQAGALAGVIGWTLLAVMLVDAIGRFGWIVDLHHLSYQKVHFVVAYMDIMGYVAPAVTILFYLRVRLSIDLKNDSIPILVNLDMLRGRKRYEWIESSAFLLVLMMLIISMSDAYALGFMRMNHLENSVVGVAIEQMLLTVCIPLCVILSISAALILEKSIRFFPQMQEDLERK